MDCLTRSIPETTKADTIMLATEANERCLVRTCP